MDLAEARGLGVELAKAAGAKRTAATIEDEQACYRDILTTAAEEVDRDTFVENVLKGPPEWAQETIVHVHDLGGAHLDALVQKTTEKPETALATLRFAGAIDAHRDTLTTAAGELAAPIGNISTLSLLDDGGFDCWFTMLWVNNGQAQPRTGESDKDKWVWSPLLHLNITKRTEMKCAAFELEKAPLAPGNEVWMYVDIKAGTHAETPLRFTYDPNTAQKALFTITGTTTSPSLGFNGFAG